MNILFACSHTPAPVYDLHAIQTQLSANVSRSSLYKENNKESLSTIASYKNHADRPEFYQVMPGDTLFSIAWEYNLNHKDLASINNIKSGLIYPGQRLRLKIRQDELLFDADSLIAALNKDVLKKRIQSRFIAQSHNSSQSNSRTNLASKSKVLNQSVTSSSKNSQKRSRNKANLKSANKKINWIWPTNGKVLTGFSMHSNKGLDISARRGQPVRATAPGQVVYRGSGLRGYGNLVIIKHDNNYLSAYAHNKAIYVAENEIVKSGQKIADVGSSGTKVDKLHFEIRYKGKPVDPLNYLPKKN